MGLKLKIIGAYLFLFLAFASAGKSVYDVTTYGAHLNMDISQVIIHLFIYLNLSVVSTSRDNDMRWSKLYM